MDETSPLEQAIQRLTEALDTLDAAVELRAEGDHGRETMNEQIHAFSSDRARLASELDDAQARSRELESVNRQAASRIDEAMTTIHAVIAANQR
jgi:chromosome segregation ATPase